MTYTAHVAPSVYALSVYRLSGIQSAAWHDRGLEGDVVRREILHAAAGRPIYDVNGTLLSNDPRAPERSDR